MNVLITGGAGFLGRRVAAALLSDDVGLPRVSRLIAADTFACPIDDPRIERRAGTITDPDFVTSIVESDVDLVYHLAAVVSGQAEAEFDHGMRVNVDATRGLLEACRRLRKAPRFVFTSSVAAFGGPLPRVVPEDMAVRPESSYGAAKAIGELLVSEYSRRGFIDGISCRLPIVAVRPGAPNSAASSFVSGIIREPLLDIDTVCPVPLDTPLWVSSPGTATSNLLHAARLTAAALDGRRQVNLPGLAVTPAEMLASLERVGGTRARSRVRCELDDRVIRIVTTWPAAFDVSVPLALGFTADPDIDSIVRQFCAEHRLDGLTTS